MDEPLSQFFYCIFDASLPRLGPGDDASTLRALRSLLELKDETKSSSRTDPMRVLDIGCGNGAQTLQLARCYHRHNAHSIRRLPRGGLERLVEVQEGKDGVLL